MKLWLLALLLLGVLLSAALAEQEQPRTRREAKSFQESEQADDDDEEDDEGAEEEEQEEEYSEEEVDVVKEEKKEGEKKEKKKEQKPEERQNPCVERTCRRGEICIVDKRRRARCTCIPKCRDPDDSEDDRFQVCSRRNVTYMSECDLDRDHCLCRRQLEGCSTPNTGKIRLDYYGPCQEITPCSEREFGLFPGRMREWLFVIMQQMRFVTRRELLFTIQSLKALEHCLLPFLDHCDTDTDGRVTLWEWGRCLGLEEGKIKDECKNVRRAAGQVVKK